MRKPLQSMMREIRGLRRNEDIECVHRMRVASRRLRNAVSLFADELPPAARRRWKKHLRAITKSLGEARDLDVQIAFLRGYVDSLSESSEGDRPGLGHVLAGLRSRRAAVQAEVLCALDRLDSRRTLANLAGWTEEQLGAPDARATDPGELRREAAFAICRRLDALFAFEPYVDQPEAARELHAMRIAAKRLRYTLEAYAPLYADELAMQVRWGRQLQDWLGEIHDCDVWDAELGRLADELDARRHAMGERLRPGIEHLRAVRSRDRAGVYEEFRSAWRTAAAEGRWDEFRKPFVEDQAVLAAANQPHQSAAREGTSMSENPESNGVAPCKDPAVCAQVVDGCEADGRLRPVASAASPGEIEVARDTQSCDGEGGTVPEDREGEGILPVHGEAGEPAAAAPATDDFAADGRLAPVLALARSCSYEVGHTHQVTRLALRLFDELAELHGLGAELRFWLTCAGLLHDIGWVEGRAKHHKTALRLIMESPLLPWDERLRRIVGLVARYHRKALPRDDHPNYEDLSEEDRADVRKLAAILRIADALDYSHTCAVDDVTCRVTSRRIKIRCTASRPADVECARAIDKDELAAEVFDREISVTWHPR
jgi:CHAD domain-containing protein